jgi:hypothetical protein
MLRDLLERFSKQRFVPGDRGSEIQYQPDEEHCEVFALVGFVSTAMGIKRIFNRKTEILRGFGTRRDFFPCRIYSFNLAIAEAGF